MLPGEMKIVAEMRTRQKMGELARNATRGVKGVNVQAWPEGHTGGGGLGKGVS